MGSNRNQRSPKTERGNTRDVVAARIGDVTIYSRGSRYYLYYRTTGGRQSHGIQGERCFTGSVWPINSAESQLHTRLDFVIATANAIPAD